MSTEPKVKREAFFVEGVPEMVRLQFKSACALRKKSMKWVIIKMMTDYAAGRRTA